MAEVVFEGSRTGRALAQLLEGGPPGTVNWTGAPLAEAGELPVLNALSRTNKLNQLLWLELRGIRVPRWSLQALPGWLPRRWDHQQGRDFTSPPANPDFWVEPLNIQEEWRIHVVGGKVIRSGRKIPRIANYHPWIRSHRLGWKISYVGGPPAAARQLAKDAVGALQLDFAGVDLALVPEPLVLEVNTCPGLDRGTLALYVRALEQLLEAQNANARNV